MSSNTNLVKAKTGKNDEFYTREEDISLEIVQYPGAFKDKIVYMPCDTQESAFWKYFIGHADDLGWKKVIASHFNPDGKGEMSVAEKKENQIEIVDSGLYDTGDFLSKECLEILGSCDVVVTNLPFSLFRSYVRAMMDAGVDFLVIGGKNGGKYQDTVEYVVNGKMRLGHNEGHGTMRFSDPDGAERSVGAYWFTTLAPKGSPRKLVLENDFDPRRYPKYANYDAIEVSKVADIPKGYKGKMGVPITFLEFYDPDEWELLGTNATVLKDAPQDPHIKARSHLYRRHNLYLEQEDGTYKRIYDRLIICRKNKS